jgi:hypothetical protein
VAHLETKLWINFIGLAFDPRRHVLLMMKPFLRKGEEEYYTFTLIMP